MNPIVGYVTEIVLTPGRQDCVMLGIDNKPSAFHFLRRDGKVTVQNSDGVLQAVQIEDLPKILMMHKGAVRVVFHQETQFYGAACNAEFTLIKPEEHSDDSTNRPG